MTWIGLDIGGANLKAADGQGWARSVSFALWRQPDELSEAIARVLAAAPFGERIAVTMTGELCDCFASKVEGVRHILAAVQTAAGSREVRVYLMDGRLAGCDEALRSPELAAASNWHALARFVCRYAAGRCGLLIDVGSTTTDIVPLVDGRPQPSGTTDTTRLLTGELVYTGVCRTPVCATVRQLPWRGSECPVAAELFATSGDAHMVLGHLPEQSMGDWSADGRPLTREHARQRLARMICADASTFTMQDAEAAALAIFEAQVEQVQRGVEQVVRRGVSPPEYVVLSGQGEFLGLAACQAALSASVQRISLGERLGQEVAAAAPAHALAILARKGA